MRVNQRFLVAGCLLIFLSIFFWYPIHDWDAETTRAYNNYEIDMHELNMERGGISFGYAITIIMFIAGIILIILCLFPKKVSQNISNRYCPDCGRAFPFDANICPYCGKKFEDLMK